MAIDKPGEVCQTLVGLIDACKTEVKSLQGSPCFAMSRGGKELFHTNFLSFVLEIDADTVDEKERTAVSAVQAALIKVLFGADGGTVTPPTAVQTWREQNNLDLVVLAAPQIDVQIPSFVGCGALEKVVPRSKGAGSILGLVGVVIEAKFKALPTRDQLRKYNARLQREIRLDLAESIAVDEKLVWGSVGFTLDRDASSCDASSRASFVAREKPADPSAPDDRSSQGGRGSPIFGKAAGHMLRILLSPEKPNWLDEVHWKHLAWDKLVEAMKEAIPTAAPRTGLVELLRDYVHFTDQLLRIIKKTRDAANAYCGPRSSERFEKMAAVHKPFVKLRVHDVVGKVAFDRLRERLLTDLAAKCRNTEVFHFDSYTFLSNGTPGIGLEFACFDDEKKKRKVGFGIQIQGTSYRHFVTASNAREGKVLFELAMLIGKPLGQPKGERGWWQIERVAHPPNTEMTAGQIGKKVRGRRKRDHIADAGLRRFGEDAFLYTEIDIATYSFADLSVLVASSLDCAAETLKRNGQFLNEACLFVRPASRSS